MKISEGRFHPKNKLNQLTGKEWIRFTKSWLVCNPPKRSSSQIQHPGKYPEELAGEFIKFFTNPGEIVLDPFSGVGSTVVAAATNNRVGIGIEINEHYHKLALEHLGTSEGQHLIHGDAFLTDELLSDRKINGVDFIMTSPPYWNMLSQSRGNVHSNHKKRKDSGLDIVYTENDPRDLGNISDYNRFLRILSGLFLRIVSHQLRSNRYMVIVVQNMRSPEGCMVTLAWDLVKQLETFMIFKGERIWCQDNKKLGIWGYPSEFVSNVHHHYCLIFKKP